MLKSNNPYTLRTDNSGETPCYFVRFKDGQAVTHEIEIDAKLYKAFDDFRKDENRQCTSFGRHIEHSELFDETLYDRAFRKPESVEDTIIKRERMVTYRRAVTELPEIQRRRFVLYYEQGLTYSAIGRLEGCSLTSIRDSVDRAKEKIKKKLEA